MALIACTECGKEISDKAAACPGCGAPAQTLIATPDVGACPACGSSVSMSAGSCQKCKAIFSDDGWKPVAGAGSIDPVANVPAGKTGIEKEKSSVWKWLVGVPVGGFILMMIVGSCAGNSPEGKERQASRDAISYCWGQQSKKSLDPSAARFAASACEKMESDYRAKWGRNP